MTPASLTSALREAGDLTSGRIVDIAFSPLSATGQSATLARIDVEYHGAPDGAPNSLAVKVPSLHAGTRAFARQLGGYRREVLLFKTFGKDSALPSPKVYMASYDDKSDDFLIVMEDLSAGRPGSPFHDSVEDVGTALSHLAAMHAAYWAAPALAAHSWLRQWDHPDTLRGLGAALRQALPEARTAFGDLVSGYSWRVAETWLTQWDLFCAHRPEGAPTLAHVDPHPGQMFFPTPAQPRFVLVDWQDVARAWGALDVARLLAMGLAPETRRQHEQRLIDLYFVELLAGGVTGLTRERIWEQVRIMNLWNFHMNILAAVHSDVSSMAAHSGRVALDWREVLFARVDQAMQDWDTGEALVRWLAEARHG
ncbi:MAG: phosphotransferase [Hyphomicrobiales bacterium]|nr:phosphotransferase [Hyphomicrobiales bacterium]